MQYVALYLGVENCKYFFKKAGILDSFYKIKNATVEKVCTRVRNTNPLKYYSIPV